MYKRLLVPALVLALTGCIPTGGTQTSCSACDEAEAVAAGSCCEAQDDSCCAQSVTVSCCDEACSTKKAQTVVELKTGSLDQLRETIAAHQGKVVVVSVWSVKCEPCREMLAKVTPVTHVNDERLACVTVAVDAPAEANEIHGYLVKLGPKSANYRLTDDASAWKSQLQIEQLPAVLVYDQQGQLVSRLTLDDLQKEMSAEATLETMIRSMLAGN